MSQHGYDELPYADYCFPRTHPEHLFAVSALCGSAGAALRALPRAGARLRPRRQPPPDGPRPS
ncbi:MAG: hypothetical protein IPF99_13080 [Deltaproteobacteria bacterium]|nr:hypothetical protein [Deltaproteobacteria bacterium]